MSHPISQFRSAIWPAASIPALLAALLFLSPYPSAYGGSAPEVGDPTCVKWCGNGSESSGSTTSKPRSGHKSTPMPIIDISPMIDATKARIKKSKEADMAAAKAADAIRLKQEAKQRAAAQAQQNEERKAILNMSSGLKDVTVEAPNNITLKPIPPASGLARSQLDCAASIKPDVDHSDPGAESWEKHTGGCTPTMSNVPPVPPPTRVENQADQRAKLLDSLMQQISTKHETLTQLDQEIAASEQEVAQESLKTTNPDKPESDAVRRAREALEKARADRARTADELAKLEQQEQSTRNKTPQ